MSITAQELNIEAPDEVWGVIAEFGLGEDAYTVVVFWDTASIYFSTGKIIIGAGEHESVRQECVKVLSAAADVIEHLSPAEPGPYPPDQHMTVYMRIGNDDTLASSEISEAELRSGNHALSRLYFQLHQLIAAIRITATAAR